MNVSAAAMKQRVLWKSASSFVTRFANVHYVFQMDTVGISSGNKNYNVEFLYIFVLF